MKEIYRKTAIGAFVIGIVLAIAGLLYGIFVWQRWVSHTDILIQLAAFAFFSFAGSWFFHSAYVRTEDKGQISADALNFSMNELIFQTMPALVPHMLLVDNEGRELFSIRPTERQPIRKWLCFASPLSKGWIFPVTYDVFDRNGIRAAMFQFKTAWGRKVIYIGDGHNELIGRFEMPLLKGALKNRGILYNANGDVWRELKATSVYGDIDVRDEEDRLTASYRYGMFPYTLHPAFEAVPANFHVRLGDHIDADERKAYMAIFAYWFIQS